jgi:cobalt-zinc-cadmium efflux system membrane fusion protein
VLPSDAIVNYENKNYIFISKEKITLKRSIQTGTTENGLESYFN